MSPESSEGQNLDLRCIVHVDFMLDMMETSVGFKQVNNAI